MNSYVRRLFKHRYLLIEEPPRDETKFGVKTRHFSAHHHFFYYYIPVFNSFTACLVGCSFFFPRQTSNSLSPPPLDFCFFVRVTLVFFAKCAVGGVGPAWFIMFVELMKGVCGVGQRKICVSFVPLTIAIIQEQ